MEWHLITCEFPEQSGGVSDYSYHLAKALAEAGDLVHVWCPVPANQENPREVLKNVHVHRTMGKFQKEDLYQTDRELNSFTGPRRLLLQWVPHGYGFRSMNVPFCNWIHKRVREKNDRFDLMIHEPYLPFRNYHWKQNFASLVHRWMASILLRAADRVWISTPAWKKLLAPLAPGNLKMTWLPVASNVPVSRNPNRVSEIRERFAPGGLLVAHFGTYEPQISRVLERFIPALLRVKLPLSIVLFGKGSQEFLESLLRMEPAISGKVHACPFLSTHDLSHMLQSTDLLVLPFPEGANSRRTTLMAGLSHGVPILSTRGMLTEPLWSEQPGVAMVPAENVDAMVLEAENLLKDNAARKELGMSGLRLYQNHFEWSHTIAALRRTERDHSS